MTTNDWINLEWHPVSSIFPLMGDAEISALRVDIEANGLREPIIVWRGQIIDGRNRHMACKRAPAIMPQFREWDGHGDLVAFVVSLNLHRRHLNESQRAMVAAKIANLGEGRPAETAPIGAVSQPDAADLLSVSRRSVQRAAKVDRDADPALRQAVERGEVAVSTASLLTDLPLEQQAELVAHGEKQILEMAREIRAKHEEVRREKRIEALRTQPLPDGKWRLLYADPPWDYGVKIEKYGPAERHYPTMKTDDIAALQVDVAGHGKRAINDLMDKDAVLFLWTTSPKLEESFTVIHGWGFQYKGAFVWDKIRHNFGHYNSVRHELLLICTRGSCTPESRELHDSVVSLERTEHSAKPEYFREIIESIGHRL